MSRRASSVRGSGVRGSGATSLRGVLLLAAVLALAAGSPPARARQATSTGNGAATAGAVAQRSITVTFDYDFGKNPTCDDQPKLKNCVKQFVVYDSSVRNAQLFTIPVPKGAHGLVKGITGQSARRPFIIGRHRIAVTAQNAAGVESPVAAATFVVDIKPNAESPAAPTH
jgi:hypothetical protein